jgi:hypothetical protein
MDSGGGKVNTIFTQTCLNTRHSKHASQKACSTLSALECILIPMLAGRKTLAFIGAGLRTLSALPRLAMEADMPFHSKPLTFSEQIVCQKCGQMGEIVWERHGRERSFLSVSPGFYERITNKKPYSIELVCNACGTAQPEKPRNNI